MRNVSQDDLKPLLGIACPTILFPYLRETISDLVIRGGFPPVLLAPVSFEALYVQRMQQEQAASPNPPKIEAAR
jgi:preprotein translocase subunit SecB